MGSLQERVKVESLIQVIQEVISSNNRQEMLKDLIERAKEIFQLSDSKKHMINREWGDCESTPSLKWRTSYCFA